jgi:hypothetical protein
MNREDPQRSRFGAPGGRRLVSRRAVARRLCSHRRPTRQPSDTGRPSADDAERVGGMEIAAPAGAKGGHPCRSASWRACGRGGTSVRPSSAGWISRRQASGGRARSNGSYRADSLGQRHQYRRLERPPWPHSRRSVVEEFSWRQPLRERIRSSAKASGSGRRSRTIVHASTQHLSLMPHHHSAEYASDSTEPDQRDGTRENPRFPLPRVAATSFVVWRCRRRTDGTARPGRNRLIRHCGHRGGGTDTR